MSATRIRSSEIKTFTDVNNSAVTTLRGVSAKGSRCFSIKKQIQPLYIHLSNKCVYKIHAIKGQTLVYDVLHSTVGLGYTHFNTDLTKMDGKNEHIDHSKTRKQYIA